MTFKVIRTSATSVVSEVRLYDDRLAHILERHPELRELVEAGALEGTISNPTAIYWSTTQPNSAVVFVSEEHTVLGNPLRVPVKLYSEGSGWVKTAYCSEALTLAP